MQYLCLIYVDEELSNSFSKEKQGEIYGGYMQFSKDLSESGRMLGGEALMPVATATSVRVRDGKLLTTDGPFAETKEALGGFYLVEAKDLDEAIEIAAKIPSVNHGTIEVRPVMVFDN